MCGRFTLRAPASVIAEQFALFEAPPFTARFNIAPSQPVPVVRLAPGRPEPQRELVWLRWGLIPAWAQDPAIGNRMINARAETAAAKPAFRAALRQRRCLVVADGFYEWQRIGNRKQPHFIRMRDDRPFAFAGLWEHWERPDQGPIEGTVPIFGQRREASARKWDCPPRLTQQSGQSPIESCTLLTTEANDLVRPIHDRMPVILAPDAYRRWLDPTVEQAEKLMPLARPYPSEEMIAYPVGPRVNSPANDDPQCVERA